MKILYVSEVMPYSKVAHAGGKVFYNQIVEMSKYADLDLICFYDKGEEQYLSELKKYCNNVVLVERGSLKQTKIKNILFQMCKFMKAIYKPYITLGYPVNVKKFNSSLTMLVQDNNYDVIELTFTSSLAYIPLIKKVSPNCRLNIIEHDVSFLNLERSYRYEKNYIRRFSKLLRYKVYKSSEIRMLKKCNLITVLNDKDRRLLLDENFSDQKIYTITPYFEKPSVDINNIPIKKVPKSLLFYGAMWRNENDESIFYFLNQVFPKILEKHPDTKLYIVGNRPTERVLRLNDNKNIFVTGFVNDASEYFLKCEIFIVPLLLGAGIKIKTLEALAYGLPIVTTKIGVEGIDADKEKACLLVNSMEDFHIEVIELLENKTLRDKLSKMAIKFIYEKYDYESSIKGLIDKYKTIINEKVI